MNRLLLFLVTSVGCASFNANAQPSVTPDAIFVSIAYVMQRDPSISEMEICIPSYCETYLRTDIPRRVNPGATADPNAVPGGVADAVSDIVNSASKAVGVGGRVVVDYHRKPDGEVKVRVEASFGTGTGAAAGASSSNPDISDK